jgi:hypothetical protein
MSKKTKIEKETRRLIESISELIKRKGDKYKFKVKKKKQIREVKKTCVHWVIRKGVPHPTVVIDKDNDPSNWVCRICGAKFPIRPDIIEEMDDDKKKITVNRYTEVANDFLAHVNQLQFWSVMMGGDSSDTKMFTQLRKLLPRYMKVQKNIYKVMNKKAEWEKKKTTTNSLSAFENFSGFDYTT